MTAVAAMNGGFGGGVGAEVSAGAADVGRPGGVPAGVVKAAAAAAGVEVEVMERAVGVALAGGPDEAAMGWRAQAVCRGLDPELFHPSRPDRAYRQLMEGCRNGCPVQAECLAAALA